MTVALQIAARRLLGSTSSLLLQKQAVPAAASTAVKQTQTRSHHPDPFNPKTTRGWKAAVKVRLLFIYIYIVCIFLFILLYLHTSINLLLTLCLSLYIPTIIITIIIHVLYGHIIRKPLFLLRDTTKKSSAASVWVFPDLRPSKTRPSPPFVVESYLTLLELTPSSRPPTSKMPCW
jgi:small-conductance mechanosensitive channel